MKKVDKALDKVQSRFGQITTEKIIGKLIVASVYIIPTVIIAWIFVNVSEPAQIAMMVAICTIVIAYVARLVRNRKSPIRIPVHVSKHEEYVAVSRPTTAEIPIVAERPHQSASHSSYRPVGNTTPPKKFHMDVVELSRFARKRIAEECYLNVQYAAFEIRKPALELFIQLKKRLRVIEEVGEEKDKSTGKVKAKTRTKREPRSTIYGELLFVLAALSVLSIPILVELIALPDWAVKLYAPVRESQIAPLIILGIGCILVLWSAFLLYSKWAYWHDWRLILLQPDESSGDPGGLIVVNKPPLLGGKVTLASLKKVNACYTSTAPSDNAEKGLRSLVLRILGLRWMIVDIQGDKDKHVNLMGPFAHTDAAKASRIINNLSVDINTQERE